MTFTLTLATLLAASGSLAIIGLVGVTVARRGGRSVTTQRETQRYRGRSKALRLVAPFCAAIAVIAVIAGPTLIFRARGDLTAPPSATPIPIVSASPGTASPPVQAKVAVLPLNIGSGIKGSLYFGQLRAVLAGIKGTNFSLPDHILATYPKICVETAVFEDLPGTSGAVYAQGLGGGWNGAEFPPSQLISPPGRVLHQQLVIPPIAAKPGESWQLSAEVTTDTGAFSSSSSYNADLLSKSGSSLTWLIGRNNEVSCDSNAK